MRIFTAHNTKVGVCVGGGGLIMPWKKKKAQGVYWVLDLSLSETNLFSQKFIYLT